MFILSYGCHTFVKFIFRIHTYEVCEVPWWQQCIFPALQGRWYPLLGTGKIPGQIPAPLPDKKS